MADDTVLTEEEMERIRRKARSEVEAELKQRASAQKQDLIQEAADRELQEMRREAGLTDYRDDLLSITIDVAPYSDGLVIDNRKYQQGYTYQVTRRQYESMREQMARSWDHEDQTGYPNKKFYRRPADTMNPMAHAAYHAQGDVFSYGRDARLDGKTGVVTRASMAAA